MTDLRDYRAEAPLEERAAALGIDLGDLQLVRFGVVVQEFCKDNAVGRYLVDRAQQTIQNATETIFKCPHLGEPAAVQQHLEGRAALMVLGWLTEAIEAGVDAERKITAEDELDD